MTAGYTGIDPDCTQSNHNSDLNIDTLAVTLPGFWLDEVSARSGWPSVSKLTACGSKFDLELLSQCGSTHNV